jgi:hypothetical protein
MSFLNWIRRRKSRFTKRRGRIRWCARRSFFRRWLFLESLEDRQMLSHGGIAGFYTPDDGLRHAVVAGADGTVREVVYTPTAVAGVNMLGEFAGSDGSGGHYTPTDGNRHAIVAALDGKLTEIYYNHSGGIARAALGQFPGFAGIASFFTPDDANQHVIVGGSDGNVTEVYYNPTRGIFQAPIGHFASRIVGVGGFFSSDNNDRDAIIATADGNVYDIYYNPTRGIFQRPLGNFGSVVDVAGFFTADDNFRHAIVATSDGTVRELFYKPSTSVFQAMLGNRPGVTHVGAFFTPGDGYRHVLVQTNDTDLGEIYYNPSFGIFSRSLPVPNTWTSLTNVAPDGIGTMMLLSDGTVMAQGGGTSNKWYRLTPNSSGSYGAGTWSNLASMGLPRLYFGSNVLTDGRVFVVGGEYSGPLGQPNDTNTGEIYNPVSNTWSTIATFPQPKFGDDPTEVLPNGTVLAGYLDGPQTYLYNPSANSWSATGSKLRGDQSDEESWVKLSDGSILSYDIFATLATGVGHAQRYLPATGTWVDAGTPPNNLSSVADGYELGPAFRLPDGRAFFIGATGQTAFYNPATNSWTAGPVVPGGRGADDAPGAMLPNGKILFAADTPKFNGPTHVYEFDPATNTYTDVTPALAGFSTSAPAYYFRMLVLPTGQVLLANASNQVAVYTPNGSPQNAWRPTISSIAFNGGSTFTLTGNQLNGLSEGASYGDDAEMSSNYPIIQLVDGNGNVYNARSFNWSSTGVATGTALVTTQFTLPAAVTGGTWAVKVIANGISSPLFFYNFSTKVGTHFSLTNAAGALTAGTAINITARALDANSLPVTGYRGTVHVSSTDAQASLPANYTFTAADNGVHTFSVTLKTAGSQSVTVTDTVSSFITATSSAITVNAAATSMLLVRGPGSIVAGTVGSYTATAEDAFRNVTAGYTGTVHLTSSDLAATLPGDYTFTAADRGVHIFIVTLKTAGTRSVAVTDTHTSSITGNTSVTVIPAPASSFTVAGFPSPIMAGTPGTFTVTARDPYGNVAVDYSGLVHFRSSDAQADLPADSRLTFGSGTFRATLKTTGPQTLSAVDTPNNLQGMQAGIVVTPAPASTLQVVGFPASTVAGSINTFSVTVQDAYGNTVPTYTGTVHFSSSDPLAGLPIDYTFTPGDGGRRTFGAFLATVGMQTLTASDTVNPALTGSQTGLTVTPAAPDHFSITTTAAVPGIAGTPFDVIVTVQDRFGNTVTGYAGTIHFSSADPYGASLPADYTFQPGDAGVAVFPAGAALYTAGTWDVTATDSSGVAGMAFVQVQAAPAAALQVIAPASATAGSAFDVALAAVDPYGNVDANYTGTVTWTTTDPDPGVVLPADYTFQPGDQGQVTFAAGATLFTAGDQTLSVTDTGSGIAGSAVVTVNLGPSLQEPNFGHRSPPLALTDSANASLSILSPSANTLRQPLAPSPGTRPGTWGADGDREVARLDGFFASAADGHYSTPWPERWSRVLDSALVTWRNSSDALRCLSTHDSSPLDTWSAGPCMVDILPGPLG